MLSAEFLFDSTRTSALSDAQLNSKIEIVGTTRDNDCEAFIGWTMDNGGFDLNLATYANAR